MYFTTTKNSLMRALKVRRQMRILGREIGDNIPTASQARALQVLGNKWDIIGRGTKIEALEILIQEKTN